MDGGLNRGSEDALLAVGGERGFAEMLVGKEGGFAATRGALDEAFLDEVRFIDILNGTCIFAHRCRNRIESDGTATELVDDGREQFVVDLIETEGVDIEGFEGVFGYLQVDRAVSLDLRKIAYAAQEGVGYTRRTARTACNLAGGFLVDIDMKQACRALDDTGEDVCIVVLEVAVDTETCAERRREQAGTGGGTDEGSDIASMYLSCCKVILTSLFV